MEQEAASAAGAAGAAEKYQLKWDSFGNHLHGCVAAALNGDCFTDVALLTIDGRQILAHRFILSACSQYLQQILQLQASKTTTPHTPLVIILPPEITYKTLKVLIQYMYSGETTVSQEILESVLRGGDLLKVKGLWRPRQEEPQQERRIKFTQKNCENSKSSSPAATTKQTKEPVTPQTDRPSSENRPTPDSCEEEKKDVMQILVIKEEPIEWADVDQQHMELVEQEDIFQTEMTIKPEIQLEDESDEDSENLYTPLTCELCSETFTIPADWVKHVQTHTDMMPAKRQKRGRPSSDEDTGTFPPLQCDMCQQYFPSPAKWVQHIHSAHTVQEMRESNQHSLPASQKAAKASKYCGGGQSMKSCSVCHKKFPSHASMLIHKRTHTGERPYMCDYCCKGFNVKSNLLRHLRTLHDKYVNPTDVDSKEDSSVDM